METVSYDRHYYIVHLKDGRAFPFEDYEYLRSWWHAHAPQGVLSHVTVEDYPPDYKPPS